MEQLRVKPTKRKLEAGAAGGEPSVDGQIAVGSQARRSKVRNEGPGSDVSWTEREEDAANSSPNEFVLMSSNLTRVPEQAFGMSETLVSLDLSRNKIAELPPSIASFKVLRRLNVSRNHLRALPVELGCLHQLEQLIVLSNKFRSYTNSVLPVFVAPPKVAANHLGCNSSVGDQCHPQRVLPNLKLLDLRFNKNMKQRAHDGLAAVLGPHVEILVTTKPVHPGPGRGGDEATAGIVGAHACDRDASLLRSQLEPYSTPYLRSRLLETFGVESAPGNRPEIMSKLLEAYEKDLGSAPPEMLKKVHPESGGRQVRRVAGIPVRKDLAEDLLNELKSTCWVTNDKRERATISAEGYIILRSAREFGTSTSAKAKRAAQKLAKYQRLWDLADAVMRDVDADYAAEFTAVALTKNFRGSPHIDTQNIGPFYGLSLGDFRNQDQDEDTGGGGGGDESKATMSMNGGALCVESGPREVTFVDTRGKMARVDGRYPHWVESYAYGDRYSVIFYQTTGEPKPRGHATPDLEAE